MQHAMNRTQIYTEFWWGKLRRSKHYHLDVNGRIMDNEN